MLQRSYPPKIVFPSPFLSWDFSLLMCPHCGLASLGNIWHKSARVGKILNSCQICEIFRALVFPKGYLFKGHLAVPDYKCWQNQYTIEADPT